MEYARGLCTLRVSATPHGIGQPSILWPETAIESIGFLKEISGASSTKGIIIAKSAPVTPWSRTCSVWLVACTLPPSWRPYSRRREGAPSQCT